MNAYPSLLDTVLSWITLRYLDWVKMPRGLRTSSPYLLHALPLLSLYYLRMHQCLLMCTFRAPLMPTFPHGCLMYHCTVGACYQTPLHV